MQKIPTKLAAPGMVLAQAVQREDGLVLVGPDTTLTEKLIERFLSSGVASIAVKGSPLSSQGGAGDYNSILEKLDPMFRHQTNNKFMMGLRGILKKYFMRKLAESQAAKAAEAAAAAEAEAAAKEAESSEQKK